MHTFQTPVRWDSQRGGSTQGPRSAFLREEPGCLLDVRGMGEANVLASLHTRSHARQGARLARQARRGRIR